MRRTSITRQRQTRKTPPCKGPRWHRSTRRTSGIKTHAPATRSPSMPTTPSILPASCLFSAHFRHRTAGAGFGKALPGRWAAGSRSTGHAECQANQPSIQQSLCREHASSSFSDSTPTFPFFTAFSFGYTLLDRKWFAADGIPITPFDDSGRKNSYPLLRIQAQDKNGTLTGIHGPGAGIR